LFSTLVAFVVALLNGYSLVTVMTIALAGAILGFLRYNFNPATIFLGDSGSLFIGFLLSALALAGAQKGPDHRRRCHSRSFLRPADSRNVALHSPTIDQRPSRIYRRPRAHPSQALAARPHASPGRDCALRRFRRVRPPECFLLWPTGSSLGLVLAVLGTGIWIGVQRLGYLEFGELARVAQRTFEQRQIVINNLAIRRATEELKAARDYEQVCRVLEAAFNSNDFDGFDVASSSFPAKPIPFALLSQAHNPAGEKSFFKGVRAGDRGLSTVCRFGLYRSIW
jgi:UDP-GlcNAc:undecaprenyl-phosphate/decaprenyl-phosphate GlcNAc-1-phosphate transferase